MNDKPGTPVIISSRKSICKLQETASKESTSGQILVRYAGDGLAVTCLTTMNEEIAASLATPISVEKRSHVQDCRTQQLPDEPPRALDLLATCPRPYQVCRQLIRNLSTAFRQGGRDFDWSYSRPGGARASRAGGIKGD